MKAIKKIVAQSVAYGSGALAALENFPLLAERRGIEYYDGNVICITVWPNKTLDLRLWAIIKS
jgi:hypothetical protein